MKQHPSTRLVLIYGLPASGKTMLARQLAPKIPAIRLDKDQWTTRLGLDVWDDEFRVRLERQLWALAQELVAQGQSSLVLLLSARSRYTRVLKCTHGARGPDRSD
jgi:predicted kinase